MIDHARYGSETFGRGREISAQIIEVLSDEISELEVLSDGVVGTLGASDITSDTVNDNEPQEPSRTRAIVEEKKMKKKTIKKMNRKHGCPCERNRCSC